MYEVEVFNSLYFFEKFLNKNNIKKEDIVHISFSKDRIVLIIKSEE